MAHLLIGRSRTSSLAGSDDIVDALLYCPGTRCHPSREQSGCLRKIVIFHLFFTRWPHIVASARSTTGRQETYPFPHLLTLSTEGRQTVFARYHVSLLANHVKDA
jgi:hypothetical protein